MIPFWTRRLGLTFGVVAFGLLVWEAAGEELFSMRQAVRLLFALLVAVSWWGILTAPARGTPGADGSLPRRAGRRESEDDLVEVDRLTDRLQADLAAGRLRAAGIDALVSADDCGGVRPELVMSQGASVLVRREDVSRARATLATDGDAPAS